MWIKYIFAAAVGLAPGVVTTARADIVELTDGQKLSGSISRQGDVVVIKTDDGRTVTAKPGAVARVTLTSTPGVTSAPPADASPGAEWTRLAAQIKSADDLTTILNLHDRFLDKYPESPLTKEVRASQDMYRELAKSGSVKFRGRWVPQAQIESIKREWNDRAAPALEFYGAEKWKEALEAARKVIAADDQNPDALAIAGLAAYHQRLFSAARGYFEKLAPLDPANLLAENNAAVSAMEQNQVAQALIHYARAIKSDSRNRLVLDNATEAMHSYLANRGDKNATAYRDLLRVYTPAETSMEEAMLKTGLTRKAGRWLNREQLDAYLKKIEAVKYQMGVLDKTYATLQDDIRTIDARIAALSKREADIATDISSLDLQITLIGSEDLQHVALANISQRRAMATNLLNETTDAKFALQTKRQTLLGTAPDFPAEVARLKAALAEAENLYTGKQVIMELAEPPISAPDAPPSHDPTK